MNGHDSTREQNMEARMTLAAARRGLAGAINDAENGIGHLSCDDPKIMEQVRAHWRRLYDTYMNADALLSDLESCARHLTDGDKWEPNPIADGMKPMEMAKGCACFIAETPDGGLIIPSEPTPGENTAKRLANTLNALTGDVLLDAAIIDPTGLVARHVATIKPKWGLSNGLCSNHVGRSQSSRTHSSGAAAQIERPEVGTIACGHRVHNHVLGAGFVAVVPRPIRFGRIFLMDLSNRAVRPPASAVGRKSIA